MRVAISGVNGFVGVHLTRELAEHGHQVVGLGKGPVAPAVAGWLSAYADQDLAVAWPDQGADAVVHLAGLSAVGPSFEDPQGYIEGNSAPVTRLFEGLLSRGETPRVVVVSTGAVYAPGVGVAETFPIAATSPYAVSKLLVETQCAYYRLRGLDVVVMRPFNHVGPGQQLGFLLPDLITGVRSGKLTAGDLGTRRDYTDVRDVARAYRLAVEVEHIDTPVLNVCSGAAVSGRDMLRLVARAVGVAEPDVIVDPLRLRPNDPSEVRGDASLIAGALGWRPEFSLEVTVHDTVSALHE